MNLLFLCGMACMHFSISTECSADTVDIFQVSVIGYMTLFLFAVYQVFFHTKEVDDKVKENIDMIRGWICEALVCTGLLTLLNTYTQWMSNLNNIIYCTVVFYFMEATYQRCPFLLSCFNAIVYLFYTWQIGPVISIMQIENKCPEQTHVFLFSAINVFLYIPIMRYIIMNFV
jgi:hypothetical protein